MVLSAEQIEALPEGRLDSLAGVTHRVLWSTATSMAGVLAVAGGHRLGAHAHRENHHHIWVTDGHATILGELLGAGSYVHVPRGVDHDIDATGTEGCSVFYLYIRHD